MTGPTLRDYQLGAVEACEAAGAGGGRRALVALPTGTGKTVAFCELIRRRSGRALVVAHRDELLAQARDKLVAAGIAADTIGLVKAGSDEVAAPVVLASVQTLARASRRDRLMAAASDAGPFATIVIDEAHHVPAKSYVTVLGAVETEETLTTGWTATPGRQGCPRDARRTGVQPGPRGHDRLGVALRPARPAGGDRPRHHLGPAQPWGLRRGGPRSRAWCRRRAWGDRPRMVPPRRGAPDPGLHRRCSARPRDHLHRWGPTEWLTTRWTELRLDQFTTSVEVAAVETGDIA